MRACIRSWNGLAKLVLALILLAVMSPVQRAASPSNGPQICYLMDGIVICSSVQ